MSLSLLDNPTASTIPHWWYTEEKVDLAGVFVMTVFYGIVVALFFQCVAALLDPINRTRGAVKWGLMTHTVVMFTFVTIYTAMNLNTQSVCYVNNREFPGIDGKLPPGPHAYLFFIHAKANFIPALMFTLNQWLADGLVLYRCCVINAMEYSVVAFPCMIYLATLAMGSAWVHVVATEPNTLHLSAPLRNIYVSYFVISFSLNVLLTLMIVVQLFRFIRRINGAMGTRNALTQLHKAIITMLVESFAIYAVNYLLLIALFGVGNSFMNIFSLVLAETQVIAPFLIILRVAKRRALTTEAIVSGDLGSIQFGSRGESVGGNGSFFEGSHTGLGTVVGGETPDFEGKDPLCKVSLQQGQHDV